MFQHVRSLVWLWAASAAACGAAEVVLRPVEDWSDILGGAPVTRHFSVESAGGFRGRLAWGLTVGGRTLVRREQAVAAEPGRPETAAIAFELPKVNPGVVLEARLSVALTAEGGAAPAASHERRLWVFCDDPFAGQADWVKSLGITLFDPEEKTAAVFEKAKIPFARTANLDAAAKLSQGLFVVGEGTSFADYRGLPDVMVKLAARGVPVCCLAPSGGELVLPGTEAAGPSSPSRLVLRRTDIITELDKRLDAASWPPDGKVASSGLVVRSRREAVVAEFSIFDFGFSIDNPKSAIGNRKSAEWPWLEVRFPAERGKLIVCGFGIVRSWEAGPAPRFLFARILEFLDRKD